MIEVHIKHSMRILIALLLLTPSKILIDMVKDIQAGDESPLSRMPTPLHVRDSLEMHHVIRLKRQGWSRNGGVQGLSWPLLATEFHGFDNSQRQQCWAQQRRANGSGGTGYDFSRQQIDE
jgi:hypothetical protein